MRYSLRRWLLIIGILWHILALATAQEAPMTPTATPEVLPPVYQLYNVRYEPQQWNNCGPATLTNALSYFGYADDQTRAAEWLKPNREDKNVSPNQMTYFVNNLVPEIPVYAQLRFGGNLDLLRLLIAKNFPVIIEAGYDPEPDRLGWMGHYLLVLGYDDYAREVVTHDSYIGSNTRYSYDHINQFWQHFNYTFIVLYPSGREPELLQLLGQDADEQQNILRALFLAQQEAQADNQNEWAWLNLGTNLTKLGMYTEAARAFDQALTLGLPWRLTWYQFEIYEAYYHVGRYDLVLDLARRTLEDGGGQYVEETYYWGGRAREALGDKERALNNYLEAARFNPNFTPALEARDRLQATASN